MASNPKSVYTLVAKWSDEEATLVYYFTILSEYADGSRDVYKSHKGDINWAKRIAARYDLELPKELN